jgi:hypothetical protein
MWSSSVSALAPATKPCRTPRASRSASTTPLSSIPPRSQRPSSPTTSAAQGAARAAATARTSGLGSTSRDTRHPATTPATKCAQHPPRATGRTASNYPSRRPYTIAGTHALDAHMFRACRLSPRHRPCPTPVHPSYPKTTTKISPSPHSSSIAPIVGCHRREPRAHRRQMLPAQLVSAKAASMLPEPLARERRARTTQIC